MREGIPARIPVADIDVNAEGDQPLFQRSLACSRCIEDGGPDAAL
jgi:hypothetical protein